VKTSIFGCEKTFTGAEGGNGGRSGCGVYFITEQIYRWTDEEGIETRFRFLFLRVWGYKKETWGVGRFSKYHTPRLSALMEETRCGVLLEGAGRED